MGKAVHYRNWCPPNHWYYIMGFGKDGKGAIVRETRSQSLGTLAQDTALIIGTKLATTEVFRMLKSEIFCRINTLTAGEGSGLLLLLADGDLSVTEISEAVNVDGPLGPNDAVAAALAERLVLNVGAVEGGGDDAAAPTQRVVRDMNSNAPFCIVKPRWSFQRTKSWNWVAFNRGDALTTGAQIRIDAKSYGVWVR